MPKYNAFDPHTECRGEPLRAAIAYVERIGNLDAIRPTLAKYDLETIQPDQWYPLETVLDALNDIAKRGPGSTIDLVGLGMGAAEATNLPPEIDSVETLLEQLNALHQMNHRKGKAGNYDVERSGPHVYRVAAHVPYPGAVIYGLLHGLCQRFTPVEGQVNVEHAPSPKNGGSPIYRITW